MQINHFSDWENTLDDTLWHELLLPFVSVKKLHIGSSLALKLAQALGSEAGGLVLPELQKLEVSLQIDLARDAFSSFIEIRELMGHPVHLAPPTLHADEKVQPLVTRSGVRSVPRGPSSPRAVVHAERSPRSMREMVHEVERHLEQERLKQKRLDRERLKRECLEQLAIEQDRMGHTHVLWQRLKSMRTDLKLEYLVQASLLQEYLEWVQWERLERERLKQEHLEQEQHLEWKRLERACLERAHLERARVEQVRLERARVVANWVRAARSPAPAALALWPSPLETAQVNSQQPQLVVKDQ